MNIEQKKKEKKYINSALWVEKKNLFIPILFQDMKKTEVLTLGSFSKTPVCEYIICMKQWCHL